MLKKIGKKGSTLSIHSESKEKELDFSFILSQNVPFDRYYSKNAILVYFSKNCSLIVISLPENSH